MRWIPDRQQVIAEAAAISRVTAANANPLAIPLSPDLLVRSKERGRFRPPLSLAKTAPQLADELHTLLEELYAINEGHAGEKVLEVVAYYALTGLAQDLENRFRSWAEQYFRQRADRHCVNPMVHDDPYFLFEKLVRECESILGGLGRCEDSVGPIFLSLSLDYVPWLLYTLLWRNLIAPRQNGFELRYRPSDPTVRESMRIWLEMTGWLDNHLVPFLEQLAERIPVGELKRHDDESAESARVRLTATAEDIQKLRPLLRTLQPHRTIIELGSGLSVAWAWGHRQGIANLSTGSTAEVVRARVEKFQSGHAIAVSHDGLLFDFRMPWVTAADCGAVAGTHALYLNCYLLERFHERLFALSDPDRLHQNPAGSPNR